MTSDAFPDISFERANFTANTLSYWGVAVSVTAGRNVRLH
jgi:hypothetical protein